VNPAQWWKHGVVYQIYPRSFMDANGDGVGDLEGIRRRLDHLTWLGIDAIWLSPIFRSPMKDFGYDVSDYCDVDPLFGSLDDFDRLLAAAHERGLRVILDWVPNHSSDQHRWFIEARASREAPTRHFYVWRDPRPGGGLPNNWVSIFGGPAWEWDEGTGQYYLHSFLREQPELDWRNPELARAMHETLHFWLRRGVDGFRIDVVHRLAKDPELRDNPLVEGRHGYASQRHLHDENHPDVHEVLRGIRRVLDAYAERMTVGEVYLLDPREVARYYGQNDELHLAFNFSFLHSPWSASRFREEVERMEGLLRDSHGWPTLVLSSHDVPRHASRYDADAHGDARLRIAALMLLTLRGTPFLYYGEEIGMRNTPVPPDRMQDPLAWTLSPEASRDGERTPMAWEPAPNAGFTEGMPWLPAGADAGARNVAAQRDDPASLLRLYRSALGLRRRSACLHSGSYRSLDAPDGVFAYERASPGSLAHVALNFAAEPRRVQLPAGPVVERLGTEEAAGAHLGDEGSLELGPTQGVVLIRE
jgi:alpha-glucosidase